MYNLSEKNHIFLHVTYSMLEEGYDIDEILGMWVLADEEKIGELMESLTLTEEIDMTNQDLQDISRYYFYEGRTPRFDWSWLGRLFGRKIKPPSVKPPVKPPVVKPNPTKPPTTSGGRPITQGGGSSTRTQSPKVTKNTTGTLKDKLKKNAPIIGGAAVVGGGLMIGGSDLLPPEPGDGNSAPRSDSSNTDQDDKAAADKAAADKAAADKAAAEEEARRRAEADARSSPTKSYGWWKLKNQPKDLYKNSPGYRVSRDAYRNIRANPVPSMYDHYEVIADYLINEGHASDIEEADYVMRQLDEEFIQSIVESSCGSHKKKKRKK